MIGQFLEMSSFVFKTALAMLIVCGTISWLILGTLLVYERYKAFRTKKGKDTRT